MKTELIDFMGSDLTVVNAARVSFDKESEWEWIEGGVKTSTNESYQDLSVKDQKLINYLAKHEHFTPFTHVVITMRETVPIFVARQRFKHVVGFSYNEISRRYVDTPPEFFVPDSWRKAAENKKQGSSDEVIGDNDGVAAWYNGFLGDALWLYNQMLEEGVCPEQARMVLPQSMYTSYYTTGSLAAWARAYKLRSDGHSQKEIQDLAAQWNDIISGIEELKYSWKALTSE